MPSTPAPRAPTTPAEPVPEHVSNAIDGVRDALDQLAVVCGMSVHLAEKRARSAEERVTALQSDLAEWKKRAQDAMAEHAVSRSMAELIEDKDRLIREEMERVDQAANECAGLHKQLAAAKAAIAELEKQLAEEKKARSKRWCLNKEISVLEKANDKLASDLEESQRLVKRLQSRVNMLDPQLCR